MSTIYNETPSFEDCALGAELAVSGVVKEAVEVRIDDTIEKAQVQTVFRIGIDKVIKGRCKQDEILVRVVGGSSKGTTTPWSVRLKKGAKMFMLLSPDYGPEYSGRQFVPYFCACFPFNSKGEVKFDKRIAKELAGKKVKIEKGKANFTSLRALFKNAARQAEAEQAMLEKMEPAEWLKQPYDEVTELPMDETGAARSASPDTLEQRPTKKGKQADH